VKYHDPYVPRLEEDGRVWEGKALTDELVSSVDVVVIVTNHSNVDHARVFKLATIVVDSRNATKGLVPLTSPGAQESWIVKGPRV
jgi:UDP-N-acetyl-D-glucosamine dehydrogenase